MPSSYPTDSHYKISLRFCTSLHLLVVPSSSSSSLISDLSHPPSLPLATRKTMINGILIEENLWCKFLLMASNWIKMFFFCHLQRRRLRRKKKEREQKWDGRRGEKKECRVRWMSMLSQDERKQFFNTENCWTRKRKKSYSVILLLNCIRFWAIKMYP